MDYYADLCPQACAKVNALVLGMLGNNVYIIENTTDPTCCFVVDPSCHPETILEALDGRVPEAILLTHYHFDHVGAAAALRQATGAPVIASAIDAVKIEDGDPHARGMRRVDPCPVDRKVADGEELQLVGCTWKVLLTPGHTPGGICLFGTGADAAAPVLVAGDTLFEGNIGRVDFEDGDRTAMMESLTILRELPDATYVLPGHGSLCTIAYNRPRVFDYYLGTH